MKALCFITVIPNEILCNFLNLFSTYKIFLVVDNNNIDLSKFRNYYKNITFIQIENIKCKLSGYIDTSLTLNKLIAGWDKALYYFGVEDNNYDFIWFMEDDVFFYNEDTLLNIDKEYIDDDLLSNKFCENIDGNKKTWHWKRINIRFRPPYYNGMMCAVRFSNKMMQCVNKYATNQKTLFFIEALFPTVVIKNGLKYSNPGELTQIHYRYNFKKEEIDKNNIYHPVKDLNNHIIFRKCINI
jgi:hypothetical protein